jgi:hypothetical protein
LGKAVPSAPHSKFGSVGEAFGVRRPQAPLWYCRRFRFHVRSRLPRRSARRTFASIAWRPWGKRCLRPRTPNLAASGKLLECGALRRRFGTADDLGSTCDHAFHVVLRVGRSRRSRGVLGESGAFGPALQIWQRRGSFWSAAPSGAALVLPAI